METANITNPTEIKKMTSAAMDVITIFHSISEWGKRPADEIVEYLDKMETLKNKMDKFYGNVLREKDTLKEGTDDNAVELICLCTEALNLIDFMISFACPPDEQKISQESYEQSFMSYRDLLKIISNIEGNIFLAANAISYFFN